GGITDFDHEHESVHLRFRQWIRSFLLNGVLSGHDNKRIRQLKRLISNRYLSLGHRFKQCTLNLSRRAVDFVRQYEISEDRPQLTRKLAALLVIDPRSNHVRRKQIRGKLNPRKAR